MVLPLLVQQLNAILDGEKDPIANLANASALLMQTLDNISWAGFYRYLPDQDELILGPFQGKVACVHIKNGRGVCGTALKSGQVQRIADVTKFKDHIACDSASRSEIVIPLIHNDNSPAGVLDLDAPIIDRFSEDDQIILTQFADALMHKLDNPQ